MQRKVSKKVPRTAMELYIKLYIKRKIKTASKPCNYMHEAIKSWTCLSKTEKKKVYDLYHECLVKHKEKYAYELMKAEPYLKRKVCNRNSRPLSPVQKGSQEFSLSSAFSEPEPSTKEFDVDEEVSRKDETPILIQQPNNDSQINMETSFENNLEDNNSISGSQDTVSDGLLANTVETEEPVHELTEPDPPSVLNAKGLFEMVNPMNKNNATSWTCLSNNQKRQYQAAVLKLKKDYISKYKAYLESLTSEQLFKYYYLNKDYIG